MVVCAGQERQVELLGSIQQAMVLKYFLVGGAEYAGELDAKRAIDQGTRCTLGLVVIY